MCVGLITPNTPPCPQAQSLTEIWSEWQNMIRINKRTPASQKKSSSKTWNTYWCWGCFLNRSDPWDYSLFIYFDPFHLSNIYYTKLPLCLDAGVLKDWRDLQPLFVKCYIPVISNLHVSRVCEIAFVRQAPASCCCRISHSHSFMHSYGITQYPASRACSVPGITHTHTSNKNCWLYTDIVFIIGQMGGVLHYQLG